MDDLLAPPAGCAVAVLLPFPFAAPFTYLGTALSPGDIVLVPLRGRQVTGVVWDSEEVLPVSARLKPVLAKLDTPALPEVLRRFIAWVAAYTLAPLGEVLGMALRVRDFTPPTPPMGYRLADDMPTARLTPARARVLGLLADGAVRGAHDLAAAADVSPGVIRAMADAGFLLHAALTDGDGFAAIHPDHPGPDLSPAQAAAADLLRGAVDDAAFSVTLLEGVTGSGKTEVYLEAVAAVLRAQKQVLILLPEIALSAQVLARIEKRFGAPPAVWHSDLSPRTRARHYAAIAAGRAKITIGARSALFLPYPDLGLIIVDEEHESSFKQEDGVCYHARDMAVVRARFSACPAILVTATPSLESLYNVEQGRYRHVILPSRHGGAAMPVMHMIDMRIHPPPRGQFLSPVLTSAIRDTLARGEQAMLFLNRRGYAPLTLCRACGFRLPCPNCTAWLVEHRARRSLTCHHCGHNLAMPKICPQCSAENTLAPIGPGVERITEEAAKIFPDARRLVMASDTMPGPHAATEAARAIAAREIDLIIGTQIVAKGWHFPHLTLVGVVDADLGLSGADLRAGERSVQLLQQVAGRAGREAAPGQVYLQSFMPEHKVMQALLAGDIAGFVAAETAERAPGHWPPFGRLAALIVSSSDELVAERVARDLGRAAPAGLGIEVLGPAPAPLSLLRGRHRRRILLKTRRDIAVQGLIKAWLTRVDIPPAARVDVDIDPMSFL
jgi:primosomal protein N' (replication factor Y)